MKHLYAVILFVFILPAFGQVSNLSVTDCNNVTKSLHDVLGSGKVLLVASEGLDCSNCVAAAPGLQSFAMANSGKIEVWGAMTFTYDPASDPSCSEVSDWVNQYAWTNIFAFVDTNRKWLVSGTPRYYVYDPRDSSLAYEGFDENIAFQQAMSLSSTIGLAENKAKDFSVTSGDGFIVIQHSFNTLKVQLISLAGNPVKTAMLKSGEQRIPTDGMVPGLYILSVEDGRGYRIARKTYVK